MSNFYVMIAVQVSSLERKSPIARMSMSVLEAMQNLDSYGFEVFGNYVATGLLVRVISHAVFVDRNGITWTSHFPDIIDLKCCGCESADIEAAVKAIEEHSQHATVTEIKLFLIFRDQEGAQILLDVTRKIR